MNTYILDLADERATLGLVGGKGTSLARMAQAGLPVPGGFHVTTAAYQALVEANDLQPAILEALKHVDTSHPATLEAASRLIRERFEQAEMPPAVAGAIAQAYASLPGTNPAVAVRSSATAEDLPEASFAGQQDTFLNVRGAEAVLEASRRCWSSLWTARAIGYRMRQKIDPATVQLAIVVQLLVPAEVSGILFTSDPLTGDPDEALITSSWGLGESIVGGMVTPDSYSIAKPSGKVMRREIADKQTMTARHDGGTREESVPDELRRAPSLSEAKAGELVRLGVRIEKLYGKPMDIEWTLSDDALAIVQARPITTLAEPKVEPPTKWTLPKGAYAAMRNNIVELMADPLSPLFATLGLRAVNRSMARLMDQSLEMQGVLPASPIITVNHYAYYNGSLSLKNIAIVFLRSPRILRAMFTGAVERWTADGRPRYTAIVGEWRSKDLRRLSSIELIDSAEGLTEAAVDAYLSLVSGVLPAAWITEALFTAAYKLLFKRRPDPRAPAYLLGFDSLPIRADKALYELGLWAREQPALAACLGEHGGAQLAVWLAKNEIPVGVAVETWHEFRRRFQDHLEAYGHTFYSLDFADAIPADDPAPVLEALRLYVRGQGTDPRARQQASADERQRATEAVRARLKGWRRKLFDSYLARAQRFAPLREDGLSEVGLAYPMIRRMLGEVGRRLAAAGLIPAPEDVFWLKDDEVRDAARQLDTSLTVEKLSPRLPRRRAELEAARQVSPPRALPAIGRRAAPRRAEGRIGDVIKGVAGSPGRVSGLARVLHGPADFDQMKPGEVLVAPITTPAWTPLFALASAVVTDIGGPLSHGSIVARKYGIPAVLGTGSASARIRSGQTVTVDGAAGTVTIEAEPQPSPDGGAAIAWRRPTPKGVYMRGSVADLMPEPLSPLFASLGMQSLMDQMTPMARRVTRSNPVLPPDYYTTINAYAYVNTTLPASSWWWMLTRVIPIYPRMLRTVAKMWRDEFLPEYVAYVEGERGTSAAALPTGELWSEAQEAVHAAMEYVVSLLFATMGASAGSELLLTNVYNRMVKRDGDLPAHTLLMGWDNIPLQSEKSLYDLAQWCRERPALAQAVLDTPARRLMELLRSDQAPSGVPAAEWVELGRCFDRHVERYGYIIFQLDFAEPLPLDDPAPMLEALKLFMRGEGADPHARQRQAEDKRLRLTAQSLERVRGFKRWLLKVALGWGQGMACVREDALTQIGLGYPLIRERLGELGRRLAAAGAIREAHDIYFLEKAEIDACVAALQADAAPADQSGRVAERRERQRALAQLTPPPTVPPVKRIMGVKAEVFSAVSEEAQSGGALKGVPTSPGVVTAPARVLLGPEDFDQMRPGDVLVAGTTTPAWTPLFTLASAVVTDIGGPLSHGSIVAREYGIPAVMGTGVATKRIRSGQTITVDGGAGTVTLAEASS